MHSAHSTKHAYTRTITSATGGFDCRLHNHYVKTRIGIAVLKRQEEEEERVRKEIEEYEQVLQSSNFTPFHPLISS